MIDQYVIFVRPLIHIREVFFINSWDFLTHLQLSCFTVFLCTNFKESVDLSIWLKKELPTLFLIFMNNIITTFLLGEHVQHFVIFVLITEREIGDVERVGHSIAIVLTSGAVKRTKFVRLELQLLS